MSTEINYHRIIDLLKMDRGRAYELADYINAISHKIGSMSDLDRDAFKHEYNADLKKHSNGVYLHFNDEDNYTRFVLQWM